MTSQAENLADFVNESKIIEQHTEERIRNDHRIDSLILLVYVILLIFSVITIWLFKHRRFPYVHETGLSVIYGLIVGAILPYAINSLKSTGEETKATFDPEFFFNVLLPPIIFTASYSMKRKHFFKNIGAILLYAFVGTLLSALVVGVICYGFTRGISSIAPTLHLSDCILFGAMISATDPVTVLAIFNDLKVDVNLYALVFGESVLNDALAIALSQAVEQYGSLSAGNFDGNALLSSVSHFLMMFGGSFCIGVLVGCLTALLTKFTYVREHPILETALFVLMSYSTFLLAETIGFTGIVAVLFCGITQAHYTYNNLSEESKLWTKQIFELLNFLAENFVFAYIGVCTFTSQHHYWDVRFVFIALFACIVGRAANIYPLSALVNWCPRNCLRKKPTASHASTLDLVQSDLNSSKSSLRNPPIKDATITPTSSICSIGGPDRIPYNVQHMLFFSGLRGAMAFSLAIRNTSSRTRQMFFSTTIVVVMTTVLLSSCFVTSLLRWLKIP